MKRNQLSNQQCSVARSSAVLEILDAHIAERLLLRVQRFEEFQGV